MGIVFDELYKPMIITGVNIDPRYFKNNNDGTYTLTPLMIYAIARDAADYFKQRIFDLDANNLYHSVSVREVKDTWAEKMHNDQWRLKYGELTKLAAKQWHIYRESHPNEFETRGKRIATGGEDENRFVNGYSPNILTDLESTIKAYNAANELLSRFNSLDKKTGNVGSEYDTLPFEEPLYSKPEFAEAHKGVRAKISQELGIPNDKFEVGKIEKKICRISNKKCNVVGSDDTEIKVFADGLIKHLTSCTREEFMAKRLECSILIDTEFINNFNTNAAELNAKNGENNSICIYGNDSYNPIITIAKDEPNDPNYKYYFNTTNLNFNTIIATKADLRHALETTLLMIKNINDLKIYYNDINNIIKSL